MKKMLTTLELRDSCGGIDTQGVVLIPFLAGFLACLVPKSINVTW